MTQHLGAARSERPMSSTGTAGPPRASTTRPRPTLPKVAGFAASLCRLPCALRRPGQSERHSAVRPNGDLPEVFRQA
jgi:hypothetical protein